jgi:hypothetical protein
LVVVGREENSDELLSLGSARNETGSCLLSFTKSTIESAKNNEGENNTTRKKTCWKTTLCRSGAKNGR